MEEVIKNATLLLQNGEPEEALLLLNEHVYSSPQIEQLRFNCKKQLSTQYLWALNDAVKNGRMDEVKKYVTRYQHLIGHDANIAKYEALIKPQSFTQSTYKHSALTQEKKKSIPDSKEIALYPIILILLGILAVYHESFTNFSYDLSSFIYKLSTILYYAYIVLMVIIFYKLESKNQSLLKYIPLFVWGTISIIYSSYFRDEGRLCQFQIRLSTIIMLLACLLMLFFLINKLIRMRIYRTPLRVAVGGIACGTIFFIMELYTSYISTYRIYRIEAYQDTLEVLANISPFLYYGEKVLLAISCLLIYIFTNNQFSTKYDTD